MGKYIGTKIIEAHRQGKAYVVTPDKPEHGFFAVSHFEKIYRPCNAMTFGLAIEAMKRGHKVARKGWNGKNMWIKIANPPENAKHVPGCMTLPYICMFTAQGDLIPWLASQADMLGEDWEIVSGKAVE